MAIRTIILEDEIPAQNLLKTFLADFAEIEILGVYADGHSGCMAINELKPDLVLLDIQMPKLTGIEVLELIQHRPQVIFTTAYDESVRAFELSAADYLLKPFSKERFTDAMNKAISRCSAVSDLHAPVHESLAENLPHGINRVAVRSGAKIHVVSCADIFYFESEGDYVKLHTSSGRFLKEKTMKYYESKLNPQQFLRIHRSYIANIDFIRKIEVFEKDQHLVIMENGDKIKASANGYKLLRQTLDM